MRRELSQRKEEKQNIVRISYVCAREEQRNPYEFYNVSLVFKSTSFMFEEILKNKI